jgi:hypothetical protein
MYEVLISLVVAVLIFFVTFLAFVRLDGDHCLQNQPGSVRYPQQSLPVQQPADAAAPFAAVRRHPILIVGYFRTAAAPDRIRNPGAEGDRSGFHR